MQLNHQQFGRRFWCFTLAAADVALIFYLCAEMWRRIQTLTPSDNFLKYEEEEVYFIAMFRNMVKYFLLILVQFDSCGYLW